MQREHLPASVVQPDPAARPSCMLLTELYTTTRLPWPLPSPAACRARIRLCLRLLLVTSFLIALHMQRAMIGQQRRHKVSIMKSPGLHRRALQQAGSWASNAQSCAGIPVHSNSKPHLVRLQGAAQAIGTAVCIMHLHEHQLAERDASMLHRWCSRAAVGCGQRSGGVDRAGCR